MRRPDRVTQSPMMASISRGADGVEAFINLRARGLAAMMLPFYRRHPYRGPMGLFTADTRGAYSPSDNFFFNRIPKTGNSTVMATLAAYSSYRRSGGRQRAKSRFLRPAWMSAKQVAALDEGFRFTFVRDPYRRALSAFADKVLGKRKQARPFYHWLGRFDDPEFIDFLRFLGDGGSHTDAHWAPQADLMLLPVESFDFIGRLERLDADLAHVVDRIFAPQSPFEMRRAGPRTDSHLRFVGAYSPEGLALVNRIYAADFELFGYRMRTI
jgi:hypothetical protein